MRRVRLVLSWVIACSVLAMFASHGNAAAMADLDTRTMSILAGSPVDVLISNDVGYGQEPVWYEADESPGPEIEEGENVWYRLVVTNIGTVTLTNIELTHSQYAVLSCQVPAALASGDSFECILGPEVAVLGQHETWAEVTAVYGTEACSDVNYAYYKGIPSFTPTVLSISPTIVVLRPGESVTFHAVAQDAAGNTMDVTADTIFVIDSKAGGSWDGNVYTSGALGTWTVSARYGSLDASTILYTVYYQVYVPLTCRK